MPVRRRDLALLILGGAHLLFVGNAIVHFVGFRGTPGLVAGFYANFSGAETGYTFFAPQVPFEVTPHVRLFDAKGGALPNPPRLSKEETFREASLSLFFAQQEAPELAAAAIAADAFGRTPQAERAEVTFTIHAIPTMAEYRAGIRPTDPLIYEGEFERSDRA